jgi:hypothetical protein
MNVGMQSRNRGVAIAPKLRSQSAVCQGLGEAAPGGFRGRAFSLIRSSGDRSGGSGWAADSYHAHAGNPGGASAFTRFVIEVPQVRELFGNLGFEPA